MATSELVIASLLKIWHIVPIILAIVLFKKYINNKDKKNKIAKNKENEENGLTLPIRAKKKYEKIGYKITEILKNDENYKGIDLICSKENKIYLVHCDDSTVEKSITEKKNKRFLFKCDGI